MSEVSREVVEKNFRAINSFMKEMRAEINTLKNQNENLRGTIASQQAEIGVVRTQYGRLMAELHRGATTG